MKKEIFKDDASLGQAIEGFFDDRLDVSRFMIEQIISRNLLYYMGEQYLEYLPSTRQFRRRAVSQFTPTPVSNEIREYVRSVKASLLNQKMSPRVWPNTDEREDIQGADAGQNLLVSMDQAYDGLFLDEKEKLCIMLAISGTAFMRTYPDMESGKSIPDGGKIGNVASECILPFNVRLDTMGDNLRKKRWVGIQLLKDKEWVEDTYKVKISNKGENKTQIDYERYLAKLVADVSPWKGRPMTVNNLDNDFDDLIIFREVEFAPTKEHPNGYHVVYSGGKVIAKHDRLPVKSTQDDWYYSLTDFHFNYVPGRFWSDPGVSDLISPQNIINEIDQALAINRKGMGRPTVMTPGDVGLKKIDLGGHGFIALSYNPIMGNKPEIKQGTPLPKQVLEERQLQKEQMQDASGDPKNVMKGEQPSANASGILTEGLRETAEQGRYPDVDRFNRSLTRVYKKRLLIAQEVMTEERMVKTLGRGNKVKITRFKASDLKGNTDVRLELDSGLIKTKSGQGQMLLNMIQAGFFKEGEVSPTIRQEVLQRLGMSTFTNETNDDADRAEEENTSMASGELTVMLSETNPETGEDEVLNYDPFFKYDVHEVHFDIHRKLIISPEFRELPRQAQTVAMAHADLHQKQISEKRPDVREFLQIDKLLAANVLTESERAQVLDQYMGIVAGKEGMLGLPTATDVMKVKQKMGDTERKEATKEAQIRADLLKTGVMESNKAIIADKANASTKGK